MKTNKPLNMAQKFAQATVSNNLALLETLLDNNGEFEIQDQKNESLVADKWGFLEWYGSKLERTHIYKVFFDKCLFCAVGNRVVIFNDGKFPRTIKDDSERSKTGIMIEELDGKIIELKFCYLFLKTENKYEVDCKLDTIRAFQKIGHSFEEAFKLVTGFYPPQNIE